MLSLQCRESENDSLLCFDAENELSCCCSYGKWCTTIFYTALSLLSNRPLQELLHYMLHYIRGCHKSSRSHNADTTSSLLKNISTNDWLLETSTSNIFVQIWCVENMAHNWKQRTKLTLTDVSTNSKLQSTHCLSIKALFQQQSDICVWRPDSKPHHILQINFRCRCYGVMRWYLIPEIWRGRWWG